MFADENAPARANTIKSSKTSKSKSIEETYTKKTQLEHILLRPDTYVGSCDKQQQLLWVYNGDLNQMVYKNINYVPGLYKIFDEIIVNAADNKQRDPTMNRIEVNINAEENSIRVWNNGNGIPVAIHKEHNIYVPELIFGNLLTGSNFDDNEAKTTGGRNGYGSKLANIFSTKFTVETADKSRGLKYKQTFKNNMQDRSDPEISKYSGSDFTCITFHPDLARFKMSHLDDDIVSLMSKRVHDVAGTNTSGGARLNVFLNGSKVECRNFEDYIGLYKGIESPIAFAKINDRWEVGVGVSDGTFQQVSFVNSISTIKGGCHVNYIADQITAKLSAVIKKKNKGEEVKANQIKNHVAVYVNALVVNPAFDSQTKENLTTKASAFGSTCVIPEKMMKMVEKSDIVDNVLSWSKFKQTNELKKKGGSKKSKLVGITKLDDANFAGSGAKSSQCTLILTEGDSAKATAISGLAVIGRDYYGVFPLKGKLLNVREASHAQIMKNEEIQNISKILGLTFGKKYEDTKDLRYGHLMIMTDQDHDGSHIKGLLINFLHHFWPSLLKIPGFLQQFITPIVKCVKGRKEETFFTLPQYYDWKEEHNDAKGWKIKYYKGLGTSTSMEAKEYFSNLQTHEIDFKWDDNADDQIDMAFAKKRVDDRKLWLLGRKQGVFMDYDVESISYDDFVNHELVLFSHADNERSIPSFMDGFKPSQRKVLHSCFKRNLKNEIKVAQLAGYVSEHSAYHHGEVSLTMTIINMAQNFCGSNNINLLSPCGQFGTRLLGGKDAASPRYVFTKLEALTRCIFHPHDDALLEYLDDDGQQIEPATFAPIIPMVLVNGCEGIGTGWSTSVPNYNPRDIIGNLKDMIRGVQCSPMDPWYRGFTGTIEAKTGKDSNNYIVRGCIEEVDDDTVHITELPIGKWTTDYKQFLESVLIGNAAATADSNNTTPFIKDFKENHTDTTVSFTVILPTGKLDEIAREAGGLHKKFKMDGSIATTNMHMFDLHGQIRKFENTTAIMNDFFKVRIQLYEKRKEHLVNKIREEWERLDNRMRFVTAVCEGHLVVSNRKKTDLMQDLKDSGFRTFDDSKKKDVVDADESEEEDIKAVGSGSLAKGYDYLLSMKIWSLTKEKVEELKAQRDIKHEELKVIEAKSAEDLWLEDLSTLEDKLVELDVAIDEANKEELLARKKANSKRGAMSKKPAARKPMKKAKSKFTYDSNEESDDINETDSDSDFNDKKPAPKKFVTAKKLETSNASKVVKKANTTTSSSNSISALKVDTKPKGGATKLSSTKGNSNISRLYSEESNESPVPEFESLSLFARLKAKKAAEIKSNGSSKAITSYFPASTKTASPSNPIEIDLSKNDELEPTTSSAAGKPVAKRVLSKTKKPVYTVDSDEESESEVGDGSDDDESYDEGTKTKSKTEGSSKEKAGRSAAPAATKSKGVKRAPKAVPAAKQPFMASPEPKASSNSLEEETFSPGIPTPKPTKKSRVVKHTSNGDAPGAKAKAKSAPKKTAPAAKKVVNKPKKAVSVSSDEEELFEISGADARMEIAAHPARTMREKSKLVTYKFDDDSEEEFDDVDVDDDDSDFD